MKGVWALIMFLGAIFLFSWVLLGLSASLAVTHIFGYFIPGVHPAVSYVVFFLVGCIADYTLVARALSANIFETPILYGRLLIAVIAAIIGGSALGYHMKLTMSEVYVARMVAFIPGIIWFIVTYVQHSRAFEEQKKTAAIEKEIARRDAEKEVASKEGEVL